MQQQQFAQQQQSYNAQQSQISSVETMRPLNLCFEIPTRPGELICKSLLFIIISYILWLINQFVVFSSSHKLIRFFCQAKSLPQVAKKKSQPLLITRTEPSPSNTNHHRRVTTNLPSTSTESISQEVPSSSTPMPSPQDTYTPSVPVFHTEKLMNPQTSLLLPKMPEQVLLLLLYEILRITFY